MLYVHSPLDAQTRLMMQELVLNVWGEYRMRVLFVTHDIDEAVYLGSRVAVLTRRPGRPQSALRCRSPSSTDGGCACFQGVHETQARLHGSRSGRNARFAGAQGKKIAEFPQAKSVHSMSKILDEVLTANRNYAETFGDKATLALPPARRFAILTCMDARLDPAKYAGLSEGDAHVIRNAGGRASDDAIRSLVISYKLLGTKEWFVIHHTDCGMALFTDTIIRGLLKSSLETAQIGDEGWKDVGQGPGSDAGDFINWLAFPDETSSVITDVTRIRNHPLVPRSIPVYGYVYDVRSGKLIEVPAATKIGAPQV